MPRKSGGDEVMMTFRITRAQHRKLAGDVRRSKVDRSTYIRTRLGLETATKRKKG